MRKTIIITLCLSGLLCCTQKRPAVIGRPLFEVWNSSTLEIDKIEMSDSATIFYIDAYHQPNKAIKIDKGTFIRESGSNEKHLVTYTEGINLNEETIIPESGTLSFKLYFPPLKPSITMIDLIASDLKIWDIHLLPNTKIKFDRIPKDITTASAEPLPTQAYSTQPARVSGRLLGYVNDMEPGNVTITAFNILQFKKNEAIFPIAEDGSFSGEFSPGLSGIYESSLGNLLLIPGNETKIYVDLKKRSRYQSRYRTDKEPSDSIYTYLSGSLSFAELEVINQALGSIKKALPALPEQQILYREIVNMTPEQFKQYMLTEMNKRLDEIRQKGYSSNMLTMMENAVKMEVYVFMMQYEGLVYNAYLVTNNITTREERERVAFKPEKTGVEYYSFLKEASNDIMSYYPTFLALCELLSGDYSNYFNFPDGKNKSAKERLFNFSEKFTSVTGTGKGILFDLTQAICYGLQLINMKYYTETGKQELRDIFRDRPVYAEALIAESERIETVVTATTQNNESIKNELPDVSKEKMLDAILARYKGKVVVADIWGTWCGPCMVAMRTIQPLKNEMKAKDVVFLYVADETSPLNVWEQTYPSISGEHYRVNKEQMNFWGINAYPTYLVFDRQGQQLAKYIDFPGIDIMKKAIEKGL